jgi:hippurate hydrolase
MASTCRFELTVRGRGCHAAMPHQGRDAIVAASHLAQALQTVVARNLHPCEAAVVSVTQFHAGSAWNVIPEEAILRGTLRSFSPDVQNQLETTIERLCHGVAATYDLAIGVHFEHRYPPTVNTAPEAEICHRAARRFLSADKIQTDLSPSMAAEDFAYMLQARLGCYVWLGNGSGADGCTLHNPRYDFNDAALPVGITYWVRLTQEILGAQLQKETK